MKENVKQASVVMAKCFSSHRTYGIRVEQRTDNVWYCTWAFKLPEKSGKNEGYGENMISGKISLDPEYPGCPYCGAHGWISCGKCGKLTCYNGEEGIFTCSWCGSSGEIRSADTFDLNGSGY